MDKKKAFSCGKCALLFSTARGLAQHDRRAHPYVPPPAPKKETVVEIGETEDHTLIGGRRVQIGDVIYFGRKAVVTQITKTEGSNDAHVIVRVSRKWWSSQPLA